METLSRAYREGDENDINLLYKLVAGIDRSYQQYRWEWIDTWAGKGEIWLLFNRRHDEGGESNQLICQYSLIPVPMSFYGRKYLAGKTENCMSHPDYRGMKVYFPHEQRYFKEAQKRFKAFFTTAGYSTNGAAGAVREKLGYIPFDRWMIYAYYYDREDLSNSIVKSIFRLAPLPAVMIKFLGSLLARSVFAYQRIRALSIPVNMEYSVTESGTFPFDAIEILFERNHKAYGVTVDRNSRYMKWRIEQNPYMQHAFLGLWKDGALSAYAIYFIAKDGTLKVVDLLADGKDAKIMKHLIGKLFANGARGGAVKIEVKLLEHNSYLRGVLASAGFTRNKFRNPFRRREKPEFLIYLPDEERDSQEVTNPSNWFVTSLFLEGRS